MSSADRHGLHPDLSKGRQMYYETATNDHGLRYNPVKACVVPRPIGWITTINEAGLGRFVGDCVAAHVQPRLGRLRDGKVFD